MARYSKMAKLELLLTMMTVRPAAAAVVIRSAAPSVGWRSLPPGLQLGQLLLGEVGGLRAVYRRRR